jgi:NADH dehydrogenase [ubiquinone] 1 alpha subcomplex assembly factor 5
VHDLFDMQLRGRRRDRAARAGAELFLCERAFDDCLERIELVGRRFERALLIGCPDPVWPERLGAFAGEVEVRDPGPLFADRADGAVILEDGWKPAEGAYDLVLGVGTLDTVNHLPLALRLIRQAMGPDALFLGALSGGDTLPQLRGALRAADAAAGAAAPHVHPRIEAAVLAPLLVEAGFLNPVVDVDRVAAAYLSLERLVSDLRAMAATNILVARPRFVSRVSRSAAIQAFAAAGDGERTVETFEILHFAGWTARKG